MYLGPYTGTVENPPTWELSTRYEDFVAECSSDRISSERGHEAISS